MLEEIHRRIDKEFPAHLQNVQRFLRQPSVSSENRGMEETAEMVCRMVEESGGNPEVIPTEGFPVISGGIDAGKEKTLLIYGMYDVQPVEEGWMVPPFSADIVNLPGHGECVVARGVQNSKGALACLFNLLSVMRDSLPVNIKFCIEGEEELGSPHLPRVVKRNKRMLSCDACCDFDFSQNRKGVPSLYLGLKGIVYLELTSKGGKWGGPQQCDVHSSDGSWISSPLWRLIHALQTLIDEGEKIKPKLGKIRKPTRREKEMIERLARRVNLKEILREAGAQKFKYDMPKEKLLEHYMFTPLINVDGMISGYTGEGSKTVLPHRADAKVDIRLVPDLEPEDVIRRIRNHFLEKGFGDIEIKTLDRYPWAKTDYDEPVVQSMIEAYRYHKCDPEVWPMAAWSAPYYLFNRILKKPYVSGGLGHGGRAHSPNEYATLAGMKLFEKGIATFFWRYAGEKND